MGDTARLWGLVPAAGIGHRFGGERPKQYQLLADGRSLLEASVQALLEGAELSGVMVALSEPDPFWPDQAIADDDRVMHCAGGAERAHSVYQGLVALLDQGAEAADWVLVHDAARPGLSAEALQRLIAQCRESGEGAILALPVRDTLKRGDGNGRITATLSREDLWQAQTPQMFPLGALKQALEEALSGSSLPTDEAAAMEAAGGPVQLVMGEPGNLKVTYPEDLAFL
ncbi:2-C-methyl-D-erythritol 4-phosphate cytidylyltransferase [Natronospira proteinivora]|uniref:2-C-methyl-D-erythritol 4-phosphate cytidylyltransferase n=1 Tax=Natronospira proteinivora TaxID=1807133 RepID=A0ABT1G6Q8_9GAMM|nr:2-C-methyl-D-erythritol 4-phosphate cytidylyltransferase [Natronospira proteinivora]MCP1726640.1 2-C-methyl-D-erythritol 4-phosphate cytidylyltransferase [Natronospira proteinivora]